jgi:prolyl oligopeptidase
MKCRAFESRKQRKKTEETEHFNRAHSVRLNGSVVSVTFRRFRDSKKLNWFLSILIIFPMIPIHSESKYPTARKADVVDNYHGTQVPDPYRWLEDPDSEETLKWVEAQNALTGKFLASYTEREEIQKRLTELWDYPKYSLPTKEGGRYFFEKNDGLQNQSVLYMQEGLEGEPVEILDPNKLSDDGTIALSNQSYSDDGKLLAYGLSTHGSDRQEIKIRKLDTLEDYPEVIQWAKFAGIAWIPTRHNNPGFFYNCFPEPGTVPKEDENNYSKVYWHSLGTEQSEDLLVHENPEDKELLFHPFMSDDGEYLLLGVYKGTETKNRLYYAVMDSDKSIVKLLDEADASYEFIDNVGSTFYIETDLDAPRGRVIAIDVENPERVHWKELIPQSEDTIHFVTLVNNEIVVAYLHNAHHVLKRFSLEGEPKGEIELPTLGAVEGITGKREDTEALVGFTSFLFPQTIYRYDFKTEAMSVFRKSEMDFDPSDYEAGQVFATSKDGTKIPMFLVHRKGIERDGNNPTLLYGYGGFNAKLTPYFSISRIVWLEYGGVFALANLRGGGEFGEEWHEAGKLGNKQNVFDDFHACAEWLVENKYTKPEKLAIQGGSNGGLLVAACMLQRPDLYGAVVCQVPVADMLRYHKFTVGRYWTPEYGNAEEDLEHFKFLYAYSPLHNIKEGAKYPPILVTSADTDDRVVPAHSKKFVATLQEKAPDNTLLLRVETKAGHGAGKPTTKVIEELTDAFAFLFKVLGV